MLQMKVDETTFTTLCLAQTAILYAHRVLRSDAAAPEELRRLRRQACRDGSSRLLRQWHAQPPAWFGATPSTRRRCYQAAISAGMALYHGAGHRAAFADLGFGYLARHGFVGLTLDYLRGTAPGFDYVCLALSWDGCLDPVICDPWPDTPQACLWSQFFGHPRHASPYAEFDSVLRHRISPKNFGVDLIFDAYRLVRPDQVEALSPEVAIAGADDAELETLLGGNDDEARRRVSSIHCDGPPSRLDFLYRHDEGDHSLLIDLPMPSRRWDEELIPTIAETCRQWRLATPTHYFEPVLAIC